MISKKYSHEAVVSSQAHVEKSSTILRKHEWVDPEMVEIMRTADAHNGSTGFGDGCGMGGSAI